MTITGTSTAEDGTLRASNSSLTSHRKCPQQYAYAYLEGLRKTGDRTYGIERELGSWWHALTAAQDIARGLQAGTLKSYPEELKTGDYGPRIPVRKDAPETVAPAVLDAADRFWRSLNGDEQEAWLSKLGATLPAHLTRLNARYVEKYAEEDARKYDVIGVEVQVSRDLPEVEGVTPASGRPSRLEGTIDVVMFNRQARRLEVWDRKTHQSLTERTVTDELLDSQLHFYAWMIAGLTKEWGLGPVRALVYDRVNVNKHTEPSVNKTNGKLAKNTTAYDLADYLSWAAGPDGNGVPWGEPDEVFKTGARKGQPKGGLYVAEPEVIERLSTPLEQERWMHRATSLVNPNVAKAHLLSAVQTAADAQTTEERYEKTGYAPRNLSKRTCGWCDYVELCRAQLLGGPGDDYFPEDYGLTVKSN